ncbi:MAG: methyltransferase domain-containing protein [Chloroflexota bacterium]
MKEKKSVSGRDHHKEIGTGYIDSLSRDWPEPREQLHHGGWQATYDLVDVLRLDRAECVLDLCCGEGGTANWLASEHGVRVFGVDIVLSAVAYGQALAPDHSDFVAANVFNLPFAARTFDAIFGQDPDGLAHYQRVDIFRECWRVLRPGGVIGFHHWTIFDDVPDAIAGRLAATNAELGYPSMRRLRVGDYAADLRAAGFEQIVIDDMSAVYRRHLEALRANVHRRDPDGLDAWTVTALSIFEDGGRLGARFIARKPA